MEQNTYRQLQSLSNSDYQIVDGEPNIIGWQVKSESDTFIGEVDDLLFDPQTRAVRYLIVDLEENDLNLDDRKVLIPIGIAHLHTNDDEVVLPNVRIDQFNALPAYDKNEIGPSTEVQIRDIFGSPVALGTEEDTSKFDQDRFYSHHHFDKGSFYQRGGNPERTQQQQTINNLVDNSLANDLDAADKRTGTDTHHNEHHEIKPWLEPGAEHNQGGDNRRDSDENPDNNRR